jgi:hypothetical protein
MNRVADFLREQQVKDGEVTCFSASTTHLYNMLGLRPSTQFLYPSVYLGDFPAHRGVIRDAIRGSRHRFIVTDMRELDLDPEQAAAEVPGRPLAMPPDLKAEWVNTYPFSEPVVFRAKNYYVHRATGGHGESE